MNPTTRTDAPPAMAAESAPVEAMLRGRLARIAARSRRARRRLDERMVTAELRCRDADGRLAGAHVRREQLAAEERSARTSAAASPAAGLDLDRGRRGISTRVYALVLLVGWLVNLPVGVVTFEVFEEPFWLTLVLAVLADTVLLGAAHAAGVSLRRAHLQADPWVGLGVEYAAAWLLLLLGLGLAVAQAWVRWQYVSLTGSAGGAGGVAFSTSLVLVSFLVAAWCAWRHYHPQVADHERAVRSLARAERSVGRGRRGLSRSIAGLQRVAGRRRHLAEAVVARAERATAQVRLGGLLPGAGLEEPEWLLRERHLASLSGPEAVMEQITTRDLLPLLPAQADRPGG